MAPLAALAFIITMMKAQRKVIRVIFQDMVKLAQFSAQLFVLTDILSEGIHPSLRMFYRQFRKLSPDKLPKDKKEEFALLRDMAMERFNAGRDFLLHSLREQNDPDEQERIRNHLTEIEGMITLLSTIDDNTSDEYVSSVMKDLMASMHKLAHLEE